MKVHLLIDDFSGVGEAESAAEKHRAVAEKLTSAGHEISPHAVKKWRERDSIPAEWLVRMLKIGQRGSRDFDLKNYI